jgi:hypothetical protein
MVMVMVIMVILAAVYVNALAFCAVRNLTLQERRIGEWR